MSITWAPYNYSGDNPVNFQDRRGFSEETFGEGPACPPGLCLLFPSGEEYQRAGESITEIGHEIVGTAHEVGNEIAGGAESILNTVEGGGEERKPAQDKKLTPQEIEEFIKAGNPHPHELKPSGSSEDLYRDREGNIYAKPKGGAGPGEPTGIKWKPGWPGGC